MTQKNMDLPGTMNSGPHYNIEYQLPHLYQDHVTLTANDGTTSGIGS